MAGFNKLMRYCDTIAEYEAAKANGTVTDDVLVIVVQDKVAKFKGETFDWSGGGDTSSLATKEELENLTNEILKNEEVSAAAFNNLNQRVDNVDISLDSELSDTSTSAVENKAIKSYVDSSSANVKAYTDAEVAKKVDKVEGKQLSTEDFTSALKTKLEGLSNYDDTELSEAIETLRSDFDTLVSGDTTTAIKTFNEIISFLDGIEDSESLDSIIASIEQQIANKQDKIEDLETIRSGAALGATALQEHQDISHLATKEDVTNLQNEVIANEEVSAAAFNNLHTRVEEIAANVGGSAATKEELEAAVATLEAADTANSEAIATVDGKVTALGTSIAETYATKTEVQTEVTTLNDTITELENKVIDNEEVSAAALVDLDERVSAIEEASGEGGGGGGGVAELMTETTWADLVALRDAGSLVAGMKYRITDYETKTSKAGSQSAGHPFDIIVTALDGSTLDEKASAIQSARDTDGYFANSNLEAWDVRYCLDNDTDRFDWAVKAGRFLTVDLSEFGVGSVQAVPNGTFEYEGTTYYRWDATVMGTQMYILTVNESPVIGDPTIVYDPSGGYGMPAGSVVSLTESTDNGFGVVYRLIDEKRNDIPYDFKNIQFVRKITDGKLDLDNGVDTFCYTFSDFSTGVLLDALESLSAVVCNKFGESCWDNVFIGNRFISNTFGANCSSNTFGDSCYSNTFGAGCISNTFGDSFNFNTFGANCSSNTFGNECNSNTFGNNCYSNTFGDFCYSNTFGDSCNSNTFGDNCYSNTFGDECDHNTFATASDGSAIANDCDCNTLGHECKFNIIWNASGSIQNIEIKSSISGASDANKQAIEIPVSEASYVQTVAKNSSGEIKIYCEADLI